MKGARMGIEREFILGGSYVRTWPSNNLLMTEEVDKGSLGASWSDSVSTASFTAKKYGERVLGALPLTAREVSHRATFSRDATLDAAKA